MADEDERSERTEEQRAEEERRRAEREPDDERQPWAKTSSGDAESVTDE